MGSSTKKKVPSFDGTGGVKKKDGRDPKKTHENTSMIKKKR